MKIQDKIFTYFKKNFPAFKKKKNIKIFEFVDSVAIYDLIFFLEKTFKIKIDDADINEKNFETSETLEKLIAKKIKKK
ncbi:hypothetical protein OAS16_06545 [Candidatus Pelagibacter sp.]|nr:hypothetical protein [Candidatus Pelagibacter sp.]